MRRDPRALLWDALNAARLVQGFVRQADIERFESDDMLRSAVERQLEIFGEALSQLDKVAPDIGQRLPELRRAVDFRNLLIHGYAAVNRRRVWAVVQSDLPRMALAIEALLAALDKKPAG